MCEIVWNGFQSDALSRSLKSIDSKGIVSWPWFLEICYKIHFCNIIIVWAHKNIEITDTVVSGGLFLLPIKKPNRKN